MLLRPGRVHVPLPPLGGLPVGGRGLFLDQFPLFPGDVLPGNRDQAGVHDLPATGNVAVPGQLPVHRLEQRLPGLRRRQPLAERPERGPVRHLAAVPQSQEPLETQPVQHLELHLFIAESVQVLKDERADHQFGRERRTPATRPAGTRRGPVDLGGQRLEVDVLLHLLQYVTQPVQPGLAFLGSVRAFLDHDGSGTKFRSGIVP